LTSYFYWRQVDPNAFYPSIFQSFPQIKTQVAEWNWPIAFWVHHSNSTRANPLRMLWPKVSIDLGPNKMPNWLGWSECAENVWSVKMANPSINFHFFVEKIADGPEEFH
jgi:hypothetical protein